MVNKRGIEVMNSSYHESVRRSLAAYRFLIGLIICGFSCTNFPTPFENVVANQKIRPFAVVCDPPEAAPGDTVSVRLYYYDPPGDSAAINWQIALDYGTDLHGSQFEKAVVNLDTMMLPGSTPVNFRFRVPDSVLLHSTQLGELVNNTSVNPQHLTIADIDSQLRIAVRSGIASPQLIELADNFSCRLKLRAQMRADISLDVTMLLRVRYSDKLKSPDVNINPTVDWIGIITVPREDFKEIDSLSTTVYNFQYLFNRAHPDSERDTVTIDSGCTYFVAADSGGAGSRSPRQIYTYLSIPGDTMAVDTERYNYSWFYSNLDYSGGMIMDSLLMFGQSSERSVRQLLPSVDTAMHRFALYLTVRDGRRGDAGATPGEAFASANGYFSYTASYARHTYRSAGRGRSL
jgi:hypothetical protein